jgi:hypothetical protein
MYDVVRVAEFLGEKDRKLYLALMFRELKGYREV